MKALSALAAVLFLAACGGAAGSSDAGIRGRALIMSCGVPFTEEECRNPPAYVGAFLVSEEGSVVERVRTDRTGRFEVRLEPGRYVLQSEAEAEVLPLLKPTEVTVREHEFTNVTLVFDSGIR